MSLLIPILLASTSHAQEEEVLLVDEVVEAPVIEAGFISEVLDSGLKVSILSDPELPIVATQVWVQVGSAHETDEEKGFAHLFEHLMFGETETHSKEAYARHHNGSGGSENAYTSFDNTVYISEIQPADHDAVLVFEADRMVGLVLSEENLANEQKIVTEELRLRTENNPGARLLGPALKGIFGEHPYSHSPAGTKEDIADADLALVQKFYEGYYHPENMHLVVVGPVPGPETLARIAELFGPVDKERLVPPEIPALQGWSYPDRVVLREDLPPIKIAGVAYFGPDKRDDDYWAYKMLTEMLAGGELDRFREELVTERGKAVEAFTIAEELRAGGILAFASVSLPLRTRWRALGLVHRSVDALGEGAWFSEQTLETARRRLLRQELEQRYYAASLADAIGTAYAWQGDDRLALEGNADAIDAVSLDEIQDAWQKYVVEAKPIEVFFKKGKPAAGGVQ